jgi:hypothetical protein
MVKQLKPDSQATKDPYRVFALHDFVPLTFILLAL